MDCLDLDSGEWNAVKVGPETVGWIGPHMSFSRYAHGEVTVLMGDRRLPLDVLDFLMNRFAFPHFPRPEKVVTALLNYNRLFAVPVPADSLDVTDAGKIDFSERSVETLNSALSKFFAACVDRIQAELHALAMPVEVVRKYAELIHHRYYRDYCDALTWRGRPLNEVSKGTQVRVRTIKFVSPDYGYRSVSWNLETVPPSNSFHSLTQHQTRSEYDNSRILPENVFVIKVSSDEEYEMGRNLLKKEEPVKRYLVATHPNVLDASFFLCQTGDPLEDWIDGEVISLEQFVAVAGSEPMEAVEPKLNPGKYEKVVSKWMS